MKNYKYKKWFGAFVLFTIVWFSSFGCVTKTVWEDTYASSNYNETILAFYTDVKTDNIAFIGQKFHYIFDEKTKEFIQLLENKNLLNLQQENLQLHTSVGKPNSSDVQAHITVQFNKNKLNNQQKSWLLSHNYYEITTPYPNREIAVTVYSKHYNITGKRYLVNPQVNARVVKLKPAISLKIMEYKKDKGSIVKKIALTPLSVTADAVGGVILLAGAIVMLPIVGIASIFK